jgi:hypothetical protein
MAHWYFDERMVVERILETQRQADRAQAWGLYHRQGPRRGRAFGRD